MHPHGGVLRGKRVLVAVDLPERPGHPAARVAPKRQLAHRLPEVVAVLDHVGRHHGYAGKRVVRGLGHEGLEPVAQKRRAVVLERRRGGEHRDVARPAHALVALRAVGGNAHKVIALTPERVRNELVHVIIRACEPARARQVGADGHGLDIVRAKLARPTRDLGIAETVEGQRGLKDVLAARKDEGVGRLGSAQRTCAQLLVLKHLGMADDNLGDALSQSTRTRTQPTMFWPKSTSVLPAGLCQIRTERSVSVRCTSGIVCA